MYPGASLWLLLLLLASALAAQPPWGDWIIVDDNEPGTSILLRRITPKSVFVAPTFTGCSEGYRQDSLGRCVKVVNVDQQKQWSFFLERLNSMYAVTTSKNPQKEAGPFHINLPLGESPQETAVNKRKPPNFLDERMTTRASDRQSPTTTSGPLPTPTSSNVPESRPTTDAARPLSRPTPTDFRQALLSSTTERRKESTTASSFDPGEMLGDQPATVQDTAAESPTPKIRTENKAKLPEKQFVIIVTNEPTTRTEETTNIPTTCTPQTTEEESQPTSTTEVDETTETTSYVTDTTPRTTEYDESFSETRDYTETSANPTVKYDPTTVRPKCDTIKDDLIDSSDCEPVETFVISDERESSTALPFRLSLFEPSRVRFPSEPVVPVQNTQTFVRFPDESGPLEDRPSYWWPTWQVRQLPGIGSWPEDETVVKKHNPRYGQPDHSWGRRRFFQRG